MLPPLPKVPLTLNRACLTPLEGAWMGAPLAPSASADQPALRMPARTVAAGPPATEELPAPGLIDVLLMKSPDWKLV